MVNVVDRWMETGKVSQSLKTVTQQQECKNMRCIGLNISFNTFENVINFNLMNQIRTFCQSKFLHSNNTQQC